jgi:rhomboid protease GluP
LSIPDAPHEAGTDPVLVFIGTRRLCAEAVLVLEARGIAHEVEGLADGVRIRVAPALAASAREELARYAAERAAAHAPPPPIAVTHAGAAPAACAYAGVLLAVAWCAGEGLFGVDWLDAGALESTPGLEAPWRALTALTLHLDQVHLVGNLLFGIGFGVLAGRLLGPGVAWLGIVLAAGGANLLETWLAPPDHRSVGASTAVFAALGMLSGCAFRLRISTRARLAYRFGPLVAGLFLLALLGAGDARVDVLGHVLGFAAGILAGALLAARSTVASGARAEWLAGALTVLLLLAAWSAALLAAVGGGSGPPAG